MSSHNNTKNVKNIDFAGQNADPLNISKPKSQNKKHRAPQLKVDKNAGSPVHSSRFAEQYEKVL